MNNKQKFIYATALAAFSAKIISELYIGGELLWPVVGMMWCLSAMFNDIALNKLKNK